MDPERMKYLCSMQDTWRTIYLQKKKQYKYTKQRAEKQRVKDRKLNIDVI